MLCLSFSSASAQEKTDPVFQNELRAVELKLGDPAPFAGQLLSPLLAIKLGVGLDHCLDTKKLEIEHASERCNIKIEHENAMRTIQVGARDDKIKLLENALDHANKRAEIPFYEKPDFIWPVAIVSGIIIGGAIIGGSIYAVGQLRPVIPKVE